MTRKEEYSSKEKKHNNCKRQINEKVSFCVLYKNGIISLNLLKL